FGCEGLFHAPPRFFFDSRTGPAGQPDAGHPARGAPCAAGRARPRGHPRQQIRGRRRDPARAISAYPPVVAGGSPPAPPDLAARPPHPPRPRPARTYPPPREPPPGRACAPPRRHAPLYVSIVEIDHTSPPGVAGGGSAVFLHVARPNRPPAAGCVALAADNLQRLLAVLGPKTQIAIQYQGRVSPGDALSPKNAVPPRTWGATNSMASGESGLRPVERIARPLRRARLEGGAAA